MKLISWNVNGLRACMTKGFAETFAALDADVFCLQETKLQAGQIDFAPEGYECFWNYADKKGYSGTAVFTKQPPLDVQYGLGIDEHDHEGRLITLEFEDFYFVCCYTPNAQNELKRIDYRMAWEDALLAHLKALDEKKPVVYCGDLNVAHEEIDLKNPKTNRGNAGFYRSGARLHDPSAPERLYRHLPCAPPGARRRLFLVELPLPRPGKERRMAHRLLHRLRPTCAKNQGRLDPRRYFRQ